MMTRADQPEEDHEFDLVVIGSGPAGQRAAVQAAKLGKKVGIVERMPSLGGVCILTGTVPSKTFREAVITIGGAGAFHPGKKPTHRPAMSEVLERVSSSEEQAGSRMHTFWRHDHFERSVRFTRNAS